MPDNSSAKAEAFLVTLFDKLSAALHDLSEVRVETIVAPLTMDQNNVVVSVPAGNAGSVKGIVTTINMVSADIRYYESDGLDEASRDRLKAIHLENIKISTQVFKDNLKAISDVVKEIIPD